jgi:hypothetical protein
MAKVNAPGSGHGKFTASDGTNFFEYTDPKIRKILDQAIFILDHNVKKLRPCNTCFKKLPAGRTFDEVWADSSIWINHDPTGHDSSGTDFYGATSSVGGKDVTISKHAFAKGRWWVAGTLVHELAHTNGAPATTGDADATLLCCGLKGAYEGAIGVRSATSRPTSAYA